MTYYKYIKYKMKYMLQIVGDVPFNKILSDSDVSICILFTVL